MTFYDGNVLKLVLKSDMMNTKKLECYVDDESVNEKLNLSFLGKW